MKMREGDSSSGKTQCSVAPCFLFTKSWIQPSKKLLH